MSVGRQTLPLLVLVLVLVLVACRDPAPSSVGGAAAVSPASSDPPSPSASVSAALSASLPEPPVEARTVPVAGDLPVFHVAGRRGTSARLLFLHPACTHGLGYIQSFAFAGFARGDLLALQGEHACGGGMRSWASAPVAQHARVLAGFAAAGTTAGGPIVAIGYSQGATVAASLAARFPDVYRRIVLIGAPTPVDAAALAKLEGAVMMAGTYDNRALMQENVRRLGQRGVPATFLEIPGARHGQLPDAEAIMARAFAWLDEHAKARDAGD